MNTINYRFLNIIDGDLKLSLNLNSNFSSFFCVVSNWLLNICAAFFVHVFFVEIGLVCF